VEPRDELRHRQLAFRGEDLDGAQARDVAQRAVERLELTQV